MNKFNCYLFLVQAFTLKSEGVFNKLLIVNLLPFVSRKTKYRQSAFHSEEQNSKRNTEENGSCAKGGQNFCSSR